MIVVIVFTKPTTLFLYFLHSSPMIIYAQPQIQNVTSLKTAETHEHVRCNLLVGEYSCEADNHFNDSTLCKLTI